jgi:L-cystine uptake protein TcyP (sodium:dicarboxylate symporter family)
MASVFWIGLGIAGFVVLISFVAGARSSTVSLRSALLTGIYLGVMIGFPLIALGISTS